MNSKPYKPVKTKSSNAYSEYKKLVKGFDGNTASSKKSNEIQGGCYIATCVYGSYDCPEVWTLRRYRDYTLDLTWYGRTFIR